MKIAIVGHEAAKFTPLTEKTARETIRLILSPPLAVAVSGGCHLGGIDIWAEDEAKKLGRRAVVFAPTKFEWNGDGGFKDRNLKIASECEVAVCIVVDEYPAGYEGMRFDQCYHCLDRRPFHIKSGGCWTALKAKRLGKPVLWVIVRKDGSSELSGDWSMGKTT